MLGIDISIPFIIRQNLPDLLYLIQNALGGDVYPVFDKNKQESYYCYKTTDYKFAYQIANYFDIYHLLNSATYINYLK